MAKQELIKELAIRESELAAKLEAIKAELNAVRALIDVYNVDPEVKRIVRTRRPLNSSSAIDIEPKGSTSWKDYAFAILKTLGEAKAADVAALAIDANPDIDKSTVKNAISAKLSKLYNEKTIDAVEAAYKKDGYIFKIKKEPEGGS